MHRLAACLLLALALASLLAGLGTLPALSADEAWMGLFALRLRSMGFYTPHEMNAYTGPLYGLVLAQALARLGVDVAALRLPGACANAVALLLTAALLGRRLGSAAAAWFAALAAGSAYFLLKSRLAWDFYAVQPLLLSLTLLLLDGRPGFRRTAALCAVTLVGAQNHFIYLSVAPSLCVLFAWRGDRGWLRAAAAATLMTVVLFLVKPRLTEEAWAAQRLWAVPAFLLLPLAAAGLSRIEGWEAPVERLLRRRWWVLGLAAFAVWHGVPLWQALAGPVVWKRLFSWTAPWWLALPLGLWSAFLVGLAAWRAARAWHGREPMSEFERLLALWPAAYAAVFILFRNTSSLRYYSVIQFLCMASLAAALPRLPRPDRRWAAALAAFAVLAVQGAFWTELRAPGDRPPLTFKIGWHRENSRDFSRKEGLFAAFDASGACGVAHAERSFTAIPLFFHAKGRGDAPCDPAKAFDADQCRDCPAPPFYRWSVVSSSSP